MHRGDGSSCRFNGGNRLGGCSTNFNMYRLLDGFLAVGQKLDTVLDGCGVEHAGLDHFPNGNDTIRGYSFHVNEILQRHNIERHHGSGISTVLPVFVALFGDPLEKGHLSSFKEGMNFSSGSSFLTLMTTSRCFSFGRSAPTTNAALLLDGSFIVVQIVELQHGHHLLGRGGAQGAHPRIGH